MDITLWQTVRILWKYILVGSVEMNETGKIKTSNRYVVLRVAIILFRSFWPVHDRWVPGMENQNYAFQRN